MITLAYGVFRRLEASVGIQRVHHNQRGEPHVKGFDDLHLGAKFSLVEESRTLPALSFALDVKLPTANKSKNLSTGKSDQTFIAIVSRTYAPVGLHLNLGYLRVDSPSNAKLKNVIRGGIAADSALNPKLAFVGEVYGASRPEIGAPHEAAFQLGLRYAVTPSLVLDAAAGRSLLATGTRVQATAGLTWLVDIPILLKLGN